MLTHLAPRAGNRKDAADLAERLGCLPLALQVAGMYLRQDFASWRTFDAYRRALDTEGTGQVIGASERPDRGLVVTLTWELSLDALADSGRPQARPLMWLLSCFAPGNRIPETLLTAAGPDGHSLQPLTALLAPDAEIPARQQAEYCTAGLQGLAAVGLIHRSGSADEPAGLEIHPFIAEVTRSVVDSAEPEQTGIDPRLVRECAVTLADTAVSRMDPGDARHRLHFHTLTPHVIDLLTYTAPNLDMKHRRILLNDMVCCIASYIWSRAETRAQQLAADTLTLAASLGAAHMPVYQRLRHVYAWSLREQGSFAEAEALFLEILAELMRMPGGPTRGDTLRTRHDLAWTIGRQGGWAAAEEEFRDVLGLRRERLRRQGADHDDADILHTRCMMYWTIGRQGRWAEAERGYRELAADRAAILGPDHADTLDTRENIGKSLAWQGKWADAESEWNDLTIERARTLGEKHPDTLGTYQLEAYAAGLLAREAGNRTSLRRAIAVLQEVLDAQVDVRGADHKETQETRALLGDLEGKPRQASLWPEDLPQPFR